MIIFISGKAGSGKDTFGIMLGHVLHYITNPNKANYHPNINNFMNIVERIDNGDDVKSIFNSIYFTALAEPLKDSVAGLIGSDSKYLNIDLFKRSKSCYKINGKNLTIRELLIYFGDIVRKDNPYFFIDSLLDRVGVYKDIFNKNIAIVTDLRLKDEYNRVKNRKDVIFIRINRNIKDNNESFRKHCTETDLDDCVKWDYVIENNSTFQNLYEYATKVAYNIVDYINNNYER